MLGELESQLVDLLKASPLGARLKVIDSLPDTPDKDLVKRWGVDAPAAYVVAMDGAVDGDVATPQFVLVLVARNARGHQAARHGDGKLIGLYAMLDAGIAELHGGATEDAVWAVSRYQFLQDVALREQGLQVAMVLLQADTEVPQKAAVNLGDFTEFHADYDLQPWAEEADRQRWAGDDRTEPSPDLQSDLNPQEGT
ncbi:MAG: DUF1834 family protein [Pseudomonas sp.]|nr:DUF1834 family protein [Pseudomonas sp.]